MKQIEIRYTREVMFHKIINVSDKLAKRLLDVEEESLIQRNGSWGGGEEDTEKCDKGIYLSTDVSTDDFTMLAEDLTDMHDVNDCSNEIENISISIYKPKKK